MTDRDNRILQLNDRQRLLLESIGDRNRNFAERYLGALLAGQDSGNPDRLALAAHGIRELIKDLPNIVDVAILSEESRMGDQVQILQKGWQKVIEQSSCYQKGKWEGSIDGPLRKLFSMLERFFQWLTTSRPAQRDSAIALLRQLDPAGMPLPKSLEKRNADIWLDFRDYFVGVAHHKPTTKEVFESRLEQFEMFLLARLQPTVSEDLSAIDSLLSGESNG